MAERDRRLGQFMQKNLFLIDKNDPNYYNMGLKSDAWKTLSKMCGFPDANSAFERYKYLKAQYLKKSKRKHTSERKADPFTREWMWLEPYVARRRAHGSSLRPSEMEIKCEMLDSTESQTTMQPSPTSSQEHIVVTPIITGPDASSMICFPSSHIPVYEHSIFRPSSPDSDSETECPSLPTGSRSSSSSQANPSTAPAQMPSLEETFFKIAEAMPKLNRSKTMEEKFGDVVKDIIEKLLKDVKDKNKAMATIITRLNELEDEVISKHS